MLDQLANKIAGLNTAMFYDLVFRREALGTGEGFIVGSGAWQDAQVNEAIKVLRKDIWISWHLENDTDVKRNRLIIVIVFNHSLLLVNHITNRKHFIHKRIENNLELKIFDNLLF